MLCVTQNIVIICKLKAFYFALVNYLSIIVIVWLSCPKTKKRSTRPIILLFAARHTFQAPDLPPGMLVQCEVIAFIGDWKLRSAKRFLGEMTE